MAIQSISPQPQILRALRDCEVALDQVAAAQSAFLAPGEKEAALRQLARVKAKLAGLDLRVLASADDVAAEHGARDPAAWLAHATRADLGTTRRDQELARTLDSRWALVAAAMTAGAVSLEKARVVVDALQALPGDLDPAVVADAERRLVDHAPQLTPKELKKLGRRILEIVAPDVVDAEDAKRLEDEERKARERTFVKFWSRGDGTTGFCGAMPDADADRWRTYLEAFTSPRKAEGSLCGEEDQIPYHRKLGLAFTALLEHLDPARIPAHGGTATTVMVTIGLDALRTDLAAAGLVGTSDPDLGPDLSASAVRRLACTSQIIPVVLGGDSEILDLGRARRLFSVSQVKAMRIRDQRCRAEGCTIPATWCEAHHIDPWARGGSTDLRNGLLLCSFHHHRIHDRRYRTERLPNGDHRFHRRP